MPFTTWIPLEKELIDSASRGDLGRVRELVLVEFINVNCKDNSGKTPLHWAVNHRHVNVARFLLKNGAIANCTDKSGDRPLHCAAKGGHTDAARLLLENGARVDATNNYDRTALSYAARRGHVALVELLLQHGASLEKPRSFIGTHSALAWAIVEGRVGMVALFLRFGAKTDKTLCNGETYSALYLACLCCAAEIVQLLLHHNVGVDVNAVAHVARNQQLLSPLCAACFHNNMEIAQLLVQHGARVVFGGEYPDSPSPLVTVVAKGSLELLRFLLDNSPFSAFSNNNITPFPKSACVRPLTKPLEFALQYNKLKAAQLLVDRGANVNDGLLLLKCAQGGWFQAARFLLQNGANANQTASSEGGKTPLWTAAANGNEELVHELLKAGADMNIRDNNGETPLGAAHRQDHPGVVYSLLRRSPHVWSRLASALK